MSIPLPWAIALVVAGALGVVLGVAIAARRGAVTAPEAKLAHVAHLLGGGLTGFMALAFPPAWPLLAAVVGMLAVRAVQARRLLDVGLLLVGFGFAWTAVVGRSILNAATDPAVHLLGDDTGWFVFGVVLLLGGLVLVVASARLEGCPD